MELVLNIWLNGALRSYLIFNRKSSKWIIGIINRSGLRDESLQEILNNAKLNYGDSQHFKDVLAECKRQKWL
jgi:hypothetical protein